MKLSDTLSDAVGAMLQLARHVEQGPVPASRLAADGQMSAPFLQKILGILIAQVIIIDDEGRALWNHYAFQLLEVIYDPQAGNGLGRDFMTRDVLTMRAEAS